MSWDLPFGVRNLDPKGSSNVDDSYGYYTSITEACDTIKPAMRKAGRTVGILRPGGLIEEYWWVNSNDLSDGGLVPKFPSTYSHVTSKYRVIKPAEFFIEGDFPNQSINANLTPESPFIWEYDGVQFTIDTPISFQVSLDNSIYERWDAICLTPNGQVEHIEGNRIFQGESVVLPIIPEDYFLYLYVHWSDLSEVINPSSIAKTSELINDGEDGVNPFISFYEFYRENKLIEGDVVHIENYDYMVWVKEFILNKQYYNLFIQERISLDPSHQFQDRIDLFVLNSDFTISVIKGSPSANPVKPPINGDQVEITFVVVKAQSSEPLDIVNIIVYDENLKSQGGEADGSENSSRIDLDSTEDSYKGSKSIKFNNPNKGDEVSFLLLNSVNKDKIDSLVFYIKTTNIEKGAISIEFLNAHSLSKSNSIRISAGRFGFDPTKVNEWQLISIPISSFSLGSVDYSHLVFSVIDFKSTFYIDYVHIQSGATETIAEPVIFKTYQNIAGLLADQENQIMQQINIVLDASADPNLTFPQGETRLQAYYRYLGTPTGSLDDYTLISAPYQETIGSGSGGIAEAPIDGNIYGRKNALWEVVEPTNWGSEEW